MIEFSIRFINQERIVANYSVEEINVVVDPVFFSTSYDFKWKPKKLQRHADCKE